MKRIVTSLSYDQFVRSGDARRLDPPNDDRQHVIEQLRRGEFLYACCTLRGDRDEIVYVDSGYEDAWDEFWRRVQALYSDGDITGFDWYGVKRVVHEHCTRLV